MRSKLILILFLLLIFVIIRCTYSTETYKEGKSIYNFQCAPCHGLHGEGLGKLYPNLQNKNFLKLERQSLACWIRKGIGPDSTNAKPSRFNDQTMPSFRQLSEIDICNILNYMNSQWWHFDVFSLQEIQNSLEICDKK